MIVPAMTDNEIRERAKSATDWPTMLALCERAFTPRLHTPLRNTQVNDVPVIAAIIAMAARQAALSAPVAQPDVGEDDPFFNIEDDENVFDSIATQATNEIVRKLGVADPETAGWIHGTIQTAIIKRPRTPPSPPAADAELIELCHHVLSSDTYALTHAETLARALRTRLLATPERGNLCDDGAPHIIRQVVTGRTTSGVVGLPVREMICTKCLKLQRDIESGVKT